MSTKTELDPKFELKDDKGFLLQLLFMVVSGFLIGVIFATAILFAVLSLSDKV